MTTRTILLTFAATVAPLYAQQPAAPAPQPAAQVFTALATPAAPAAAATPEQRAAVFSALALLPQDISDFTVLTQVGSNLKKLAGSGKCPELTPEDLPAELLALDNIALASTPATPATYALLQHALVSFFSVGSTLQLADGWAAEARGELRDAIIEGLILRADAAASVPEGSADSAHLPTGYGIITCEPGKEAMLSLCREQMLTDLRDSGRPGISPAEGAEGFTGVRVNVAEAFKGELEAATANMAPPRREMLLAELAKRPVYLLTRLQGNALAVALCEDPQSPRLAPSPADSLLATDKVAACDATLGKGMIACSVTSPALVNMANAVNAQPTLNLAAGLGAAFTQLGAQEPANKPAYDRAAAAMGFLSAEMQKLIRPVTHPSTLQMWCDGDLHLVLTGDAQDCSYRPGTLRLAAVADAPATSFYSEMTPMETGITPPDSKALLDAAFNVAEGFALTLAEEKRGQAEAAVQMARAFMPELQSLAAAGCTIGSGLDGQVAFVLDSVHAPLPSISGAAGLDAETPRFALFAGVKDRSKLAQGWEGILASAGQAAGKLGMAPEVVRMLPIRSHTVENAASYSLALPFFTENASPSLAITDTGLAIGSSANLTTRLALSATGSTPFTGAVFALKFKPLARTLRSLATALDHDAEEAKPAAESDVRLEKEKNSVCIATVGTPEGPARILLSTSLDEVEDEADGLSMAASIAERAATIAEGVYGTATTENGLQTLHVQVKMK